MSELKTKELQIISYLTFNLGKEHFALNVGQVVNILEMQKITSIPKAPDYLKGVINLRGEVLPVIDTNLKLGFGNTLTTTSTCILVIETIIDNSQLKFGIMADAVQEVLEFEEDMILPPPSIGKNFETEIISGVVEQQEKFIMILNIDQLLHTNELMDINQLKKNLKK
ncbi:MAG: purine-binding chemotaxis protein CheW [Bacteroidales bacterium]|nr:purine-binding chemotaxis protein CheW [Bacteroidales bacterium]MBN2817356.1 purine-binding chemotaxis protein CheW [Bacteroidales bacterium]